MNSIISLIMTGVFLFLSTNSFAIDPKSTLPIEIESDSASLDDASGTSTYSGNVIISQGLSRLEADSISVSTNDRKINEIKAIGRPAHFVQQDNASSPQTHGFSNTITYVAKENILYFSGQAKLVQEESSFSGEQIEYDILKRAIRARGDESQGTRVKIHYQPQTEASQPAKQVNPETTLPTAAAPVKESDEHANSSNSKTISSNP
jgi:lipopolysaccharide export system protein LptA